MTKKKTAKKTTKRKRIVRGHWDRERHYSPAGTESRTKQEFKDECDINNIVNQFAKTGVITHVNRREPQYGHVDGSDFADAMRVVTEAQAMFDDMPAEIRKRFNNDPAELLDFVQNPENIDAMREMGLIEAETTTTGRPEPQPPPAPPAPPAAPEPPSDGS